MTGTLLKEDSGKVLQCQKSEKIYTYTDTKKEMIDIDIPTTKESSTSNNHFFNVKTNS